jgi:hypothetical protein
MDIQRSKVLLTRDGQQSSGDVRDIGRKANPPVVHLCRLLGRDTAHCVDQNIDCRLGIGLGIAIAVPGNCITCQFMQRRRSRRQRVLQDGHTKDGGARR